VERYQESDGEGQSWFSGTYDSCMYDELRDLSLSQVRQHLHLAPSPRPCSRFAQIGCTTPWLPDKSDICEEGEERRKAALALYRDNERNQLSLCAPPCLFSNTYFGPPATGEREEGEKDAGLAIFYFKRDIKVHLKGFQFTQNARTKVHDGILFVFPALHAGRNRRQRGPADGHFPGQAGRRRELRRGPLQGVLQTKGQPRVAGWRGEHFVPSLNANKKWRSLFIRDLKCLRSFLPSVEQRGRERGRKWGSWKG